MRAWWTWVVEGLARRESATAMALWRIAVGLVILGELLLTWWSGAAELFWHDADGGGYLRSLQSRHWIFDLTGLTNSGSDLVLWTTVACLVCVVLGFGTNAAALAAMFGVRAMFSLSSGAGGGHDRMFTIALFLLVLIRSDATLSLWCRLRTGRWTSDATIPAWSRIWLIWNLVLIYASAGVVKLAAEWLPQGDFRAVYNALLTPHWSRGDFAWLWGPLFPLTQVGTALTVVWESTFVAVPLWLVLRSRPRAGWRARLATVDVRSIYVAIGVVMHTTLLVFTNLGPFSMITMAWYIPLYSSDEWHALWRRLKPQVRQQTPRDTVGSTLP